MQHTVLTSKENNNKLKVRLIAFYLPQFHPIPENNRWWEDGFTEWTHVKRARPLFVGHYQPRVPGELGYYNLLDPKVRKKQAKIAKKYGIEGFSYWHYWFGGGKRLLEKPFQEVLKSGAPDFPFCLSWANHSWTGIWYGCPNRTLIKQTYPGTEDHKKHFYAVLDAFKDPRYLKVNGKPLFLVYKPAHIPDSVQFTGLWRNLARKEGLKGIYFIAISEMRPRWDPKKLGYDALTVTNLGKIIHAGKKRVKKSKRRFLNQWGRVYLYRNAMKYSIENLPKGVPYYPTVIPNWDNTPRSELRGVVLHDSRPEFFKEQIERAGNKVIRRRPEKRIIFIKSWNEWGEGNYLEPDQRFGLAYLKAIKEFLQS